MTNNDNVDGLCANLRNIDRCLEDDHYWVIGIATKAAAALERQDDENKRLREALPDLSAVINWLAKGCAVDHAVTELIIYQARIDAALKGEN